MNRLLRHFRKILHRLARRRSGHTGLTAIEYEAVCLIAYKGREAYARAREQADHCRSVGSPSGTVF